MTKIVKFDLNKNTIHYTYSKNEYDRYQIDSSLYLYSYNRISPIEWIKLKMELYFYKKNEMRVHIDSIHNTNLN